MGGAIPCILLAAGASVRMGSHKLLLPLAGEPVVRRTAKVILSRLASLIVVTGFGREGVEAALAGLDGIIFVHNAEWRAGMAKSAIVGIGAVPPGASGFFLHHADMPFVTGAAFDLLARTAAERKKPAPRPSPSSPGGAAEPDTPSISPPLISRPSSPSPE